MDKLPKNGFENLLEVLLLPVNYSSRYVAIEMGIRGMEQLKQA